MIFQNLPSLNGNEERYLRECIQTNWISSEGPFVKQFEEAFAEKVGVDFGISCSSGTAALHLALVVLGIGPGDEVIVPNFTLVADANMVLLCGAKPVFIDIDPNTWCLDASQLESKLSPRTRAVLCVHMLGNACRMNEIMALSAKHDFFVIEDAAQAHGSTLNGRPLGSLGHIGCFSFYATKTLSCGEGGMVMTSDGEIARKLRELRSHGFKQGERAYSHSVLGFNYRLSNLHAAVGLAQVETMEEKVARKRRIFKRYRENLQGIPGVQFPTPEEGTDPAWWNTTLAFNDDFGASKAQIQESLSAAKIQTRDVFQALNKQAVYQNDRRENYPDCSGTYPVCDDICARALALPSSVTLTLDELDFVTKELLSCRAI